MALAQKADYYACNAQHEEKMSSQAPAPYVPTEQALEEANRILGIKKSKCRKAPSDIMASLSKVYYEEGGAMLGH